jgi:CubicO group peptidase (beta-lactamase class C family)
MKKALSLLIALIMILSIVALPTFAKDDDKSTPSGIKYNKLEEKIKDYVKENEKDLASFEVAIFKKDETLYKGYFGKSDIENNIDADENTVYEWGSVSKTFVWVSAMQLKEEGKLDLDEDIRSYLPKGFLTKLKYKDPITMKNLMNHNAGFQETIAGLEVKNEKNIKSLGKALKSCQPSQVYKPGTITAYSNWGAALAGYIIERISGQDYAQYVHQHILEPLKMEHTSVGADFSDNKWVKEQRDKLKAYMKTPKATIKFGRAISYIQLYPAGSVTGTISDFEIYAKSFVSDDCKLFKDKKTRDELLSATSFYGDSDIAKSNHGFWSSYYAIDTLGHGGNTNSCTANMIFDKESGLGIVITSNELGEGTFCGGIPSLIFGEFEDNEKVKGEEITKREDLTGFYSPSRAVKKGQFKLVQYLNIFPLMKTKDEDVYTALGIASLTRIADNKYIFEQSGQKVLMYSSIRGGKQVLEMMSTDEIKDDTFLLKFIAVSLYIVLTIAMIVLLIVKFIIYLVKRKRGYKLPKSLLAVQIIGLLSAVFTFLFLSFEQLSGNIVISVIFGIIQAIFALLSLATAIFLIKNIFTAKYKSKFRIVKNIIFALYGLFICGFIFYFELFNFWS